MTYIVRGMILTTVCLIALTTFSSVRTTTAQENRRVKIVNNTSSSIYHFYASNVDRNSWEEDILGEKTIPPGKTLVVDIDDGTGHCYYDLKAVMYDDRYAIRRKFNVCTAASWTIHD
jgi:hypothetical protein